MRAVEFNLLPVGARQALTGVQSHTQIYKSKCLKKLIVISFVTRNHKRGDKKM